MSTLKQIVNAILLLIGLFISYFSYAANDQAMIIDGIWRGELQVQKGVYLALGIEVRDENKTLTLSSPNQGMYERAPTAFLIDGNTLTFKDEGLSASFEGVIEGDKISGTFTQGRKMPLTLRKLDESDLARMQYEGKYTGDLLVNENSTLPLALNVAVIKDAYSATLDSPSQNSFGIPIEQITINDESLRFTSKMIGAKFSGESASGKSSSGDKQVAVYEGTFIQGMPMSLSLKKVTQENAHLQFVPPTFGEQGGAIAIIEPNETQTRYFANHNTSTQYEIGSITKTMTAYLLAFQSLEQQLHLSDPLTLFFEDGPSLKLQDLATHTSGLARVPPSLSNSLDMTNPYAHISRDDLSRDLKNLSLEETAHPHAYSNFAYALLGEVLAINAKSSLSEQFEKVLFAPLSMQSTYLADSALMRSKKLAQGYNTLGEPVVAWEFAAASGAGAVVSTLDDMSNYARHMMSEANKDTALAKLLFTPYLAIGDCCEQGLAWMMRKDKRGKPYAWHNGMTGGFSAFLGFYLDGSRAVVMLNSQAANFDKLAHDLLSGDASLQSI
uniref:serine hydrolase domain-containing protein n=1 Tax=Ningiella ruwaisensis TaxID=2364274 RepID=UPI00109FCE7B|nr:serine hydrolase domain-containing protein [Ningiella ruwaisensis]